MENARESSFFFNDLIKLFSIYAKRILAYMENMRKEFPSRDVSYRKTANLFLQCT
jgi:hypothetical protein